MTVRFLVSLKTRSDISSEGSEDLHQLVHTMGESRLKVQGLARGREGSSSDLGLIVGQIRRAISCSAVKSQALCLLSRLQHLTPGARVAAKRREWVRREEIRLADERRAIWVGNIRQRGVVRRGQFMVP